jgi:hypothetical protein
MGAKCHFFGRNFQKISIPPEVLDAPNVTLLVFMNMSTKAFGKKINAQVAQLFFSCA